MRLHGASHRVRGPACLVYGPEPGTLTFAKRKHILYPIQPSEIVICVERCPMADATDREIDRLVYQLYGLTDEEIKIVEGEG